jgi:DNA-binding Xre family transcriptional regulator
MAKKITPRVKQLRLDLAAKRGREVTLKEVYEATGIAISTLSRIENNQVKSVEFATLAKLAEFYGAGEIADLLTLEDARRAPTQAAGGTGHPRRRLDEAVARPVTGPPASAPL